MKYLTATRTDVGIKKSTNQDSLLIEVANTNWGDLCFAVVCDGMGGLSKGELASATIIRILAEWFIKEVPFIIQENNAFIQMKNRMTSIISEQNEVIANYGKKTNVNLGTTLTAIMIADGKYLITHVGDCRVYEITSDSIRILTKDQTVVARDIERGKLTPEQAENDPRQNVLLQCIGASRIVIPEFFEGEIKKNSIYMLCSDGFRHEISEQEIHQAFNPAGMVNEMIMDQKAHELVELCKSRQEPDNITVALIKTF